MLANTKSSYGAEVGYDGAASHEIYGHPAYVAASEAMGTINVGRKLITDAFKNVPDTPAKQVALMHMQTANMWLEQAYHEGMRALESALEDQQRQRHEQEKREALRSAMSMREPVQVSEDQPANTTGPVKKTRIQP